MCVLGFIPDMIPPTAIPGRRALLAPLFVVLFISHIQHFTTYCTSTISSIIFQTHNIFFQVFSITSRDLHPAETEILFSSGATFSLTGFRIRMIRFSSQFFLKDFLPVMGIVCVSWASFLIPPTAIPGRVALLVTLFLVIITLFANIIVR